MDQLGQALKIVRHERTRAAEPAHTRRTVAHVSMRRQCRLAARRCPGLLVVAETKGLVRDSKRGKNRIMVLPEDLIAPLRAQMARGRSGNAPISAHAARVQTMTAPDGRSNSADSASPSA